MLVTRRCRLDPARIADAGEIAKLHADADVRRFLGGAKSPEQAEASAHQLVKMPQADVFTIRLSATSTFVGIIMLAPHHDRESTELSYMLAPNHWGAGLAREAAIAVIDYARNVRGLERLCAETQAANASSCRLIESLGFSKTTVLERFGAEQALYVLDLQAG